MTTNRLEIAAEDLLDELALADGLDRGKVKFPPPANGEAS